MAPKKKLVAKASTGVENPSTDVDTEAVDPPVVLETHRLTRTWQEKKSLEDMDAALEEDNLLEKDDVPEDPIQAVLAEIAGASADWSMGVIRLKNYARDRRTSPDARSHCGVLTIPDAQYLAEEIYKEDIQARWARGAETNYFQIVVRKNNRIFRYLPPFGIEPPDPVALAKQQAENPTVQIYGVPQQNAADQFRQFKQQAKEMAELFQIFVPGGVGAIGQQPQQAPISTTEQALLHLANADGGLVETLAERFRGMFSRRSERGEIGWMDLAMEAIRSDLPGRMIREAKNLIIEVRNTSLPPEQQKPVEPYTPPAPVTPTEMPAQPAATTTPPEITLLNFTLQACAQQWKPEDAAAWIVEFEAQNPSVTPFINLFMQRTAEEALQWLTTAVPQAAQVASLPHAKQWIADLQKFLKASEVEDGQTTPGQK